MGSFPNIIYQSKVFVVCEGNEEKEYFKRLMALNVWEPIYKFIPKNARGANNIFPTFQAIYQNDSYDAILVFCDTDKKPFKEYTKVKQKFFDFFGNDFALDKIVIFANPCTMQIILSHFGNVNLKTQSKKVNSKEIDRLTGIKGYGARGDQLNELLLMITRSSYYDMKDRVGQIDKNYQITPSTNFIRFINCFEDSSGDWANEVRDALEPQDQ